ncbi:MAG: hypothetical protein SOY98_04645 [Candidatus Cryptobacteroides sp.]|nr:hypothetical protein [Bacteroidales bacterium]MDY3963577.1 hypothetical protein [Candidatus Cryptobacteroides sp.]
MRRIIFVLAMLAVSASAFGQAQITTKKEKLKDFEVKTMKVVLTGNDFIDPAFKEAVKNTWTISPFEFCTMDEFNWLKANPDYYFLVPVKATYKNEAFPGIMMLTLAKGKPGAENINGMLEVISIPMCPADIPSGRETSMLPGLMDVIQNYVSRSLISGFKGLKSCVKRRPGGCKVYIAESEVSETVDENEKERLRNKGALIVEDEVADSMFIEGDPDVAVSYLVAPAAAEKGSICWKMVIGARTHDLYYLKKHTLAGPDSRGFLKGEISKLSSKLSSK